MTEVTKCQVLVYGVLDGYQTNRSQFMLYGSMGLAIAYVRFKDPGTMFEVDADTNNGGFILMHLPSTMFQSVFALLRNEKPIQIYGSPHRGCLGTASSQAVGEVTPDPPPGLRHQDAAILPG
jgi:hypothetical protein